MAERESSPCSHVDGTCNCLPGYTGPSCDQGIITAQNICLRLTQLCHFNAECPNGFYGQDCLDVCRCVNGDCDFITGFCNCSIGYVGAACDMSKRILLLSRSLSCLFFLVVCPPLRYGLGCTEMCTCQTGNCHHITGNCSCPVDFYGRNCDHSMQKL